MKFKKMLSAVLAAVVSASAAATASAKLAVPEEVAPGAIVEDNMYLVRAFNVGNEETGEPAVKYDIDYSKAAKLSVTFTVLEEDRGLWAGAAGGALVLSINGGDIAQGSDLWDKYNWTAQSWWGVTDEELDIETFGEDEELYAIVSEKIGDHTYKLTSNEFQNPLANGDAEQIGRMQLCFAYWGIDEARLVVQKVDVMDSSDNVLLTFDETGKANLENIVEPVPEVTGALEVVENPAAPLVQTTPKMWYVLGYETGEAFNEYSPISFDIDYSKVAKLSATFTVVEEDRELFDGQCAGGLTLSITGDNIKYENTALWDKYIWAMQQWWGVTDDALGIDEAADKDKQDIVSEKIGDYTYRITSDVFDNPLANGDTTEINHMLFGVQEWGFNKARLRVLSLDVMDSSGNVLLTYDSNGKATIPAPSAPAEPSEPSIPSVPSIPTVPSAPSEPDTSDTSEPGNSGSTDSTPEDVMEFVPEPVVDETVDEETAQVIAEIKVSAPEAAFEVGTKLTVKKDETVPDTLGFAIDITFTLNGSTVQPKDGATVTVQVPVPPSYKDVDESLLKVFHYLNGRYTRVEATVKDGTVTFDTDHFSTYVISVEDLEKNGSEEVSSAPSENTANPSTGIAVTFALPVIAIGAAAVVIAAKKK